jgi:miniconductance mechanosensitive channel
MMILVRQLQSTSEGLPLELFAYCILPDFEMFENFQSTLFEHIFSVLPDFELKPCQIENS